MAGLPRWCGTGSMKSGSVVADRPADPSECRIDLLVSAQVHRFESTVNLSASSGAGKSLS